MTTTNNLDIDHLESNLTSPEPIINEQLDKVDAAIAGRLTINLTTDADYTLANPSGSTPAEWSYPDITITDTGAVLTTGRDIIMPTGKGIVWRVANDTTRTLTFKVSGGTGVAVSAGGEAFVYYDGSDIAEQASGGGGASALDDLSDVDTTGAADGDALTYDSGTGTWVPAAVGGGGGSFDLLSQLTAAEISVTGATALTTGRMHVCADAGSPADYTVTLPPVSGNAGKLVGVRVAESMTKLLTVDGDGTELIDGEEERVMWAGESAVLLCDGTGWKKIAGRSVPKTILKLGRSGLSAQTISEATWTKATLNNNAGFQLDPFGLFNTADSTWRMPKSGLYRFDIAMQWQSATWNSGTNSRTRISGDGSTQTIFPIPVSFTGALVYDGIGLMVSLDLPDAATFLEVAHFLGGGGAGTGGEKNLENNDGVQLRVHWLGGW